MSQKVEVMRPPLDIDGESGTTTGPGVCPNIRPVALDIPNTNIVTYKYITYCQGKRVELNIDQIY